MIATYIDTLSHLPVVECTLNEKQKLLFQQTKKKSNPILSLHKDSSFFSSSFSIPRKNVKQEESVPLSSLYMSFELDTCSLRDVIVIVYVRKTFAMHSIIEASARSSHQQERGRKTRALVLEQIRLLLRNERERERRKKNGNR